jgi:hypothetical protein
VFLAGYLHALGFTAEEVRTGGAAEGLVSWQRAGTLLAEHTDAACATILAASVT